MIILQKNSLLKQISSSPVSLDTNGVLKLEPSEYTSNDNEFNIRTINIIKDTIIGSKTLSRDSLTTSIAKYDDLIPTSSSNKPTLTRMFTDMVSLEDSRVNIVNSLSSKNIISDSVFNNFDSILASTKSTLTSLNLNNSSQIESFSSINTSTNGIVPYTNRTLSFASSTKIPTFDFFLNGMTGLLSEVFSPLVSNVLGEFVNSIFKINNPLSNLINNVNSAINNATTKYNSLVQNTTSQINQVINRVNNSTNKVQQTINNIYNTKTTFPAIKTISIGAPIWK